MTSAHTLIAIMALLASLMLNTPGTALAADRVERTIQVGDSERSYIAHVPKDAASRRELPILFAFHPALATAEGFERISGLHDQAQADDFLIIYPQGIGRTWNTGQCCGQAKRQAVDELAFIDAIFADAGRFGAISIDRNVATGFSNGAGMTHYLACNRPERFIAIAPTGGKRNMTQGCGPSSHIAKSPVSVFLAHGLEDTFSPYHGGQSVVPTVQQTPGVPALINYWRGANQCRAQQSSLRLNGIKCDEARACAGERVVITCPIPNMGHWWPGQTPGQPWATRMFGPARPDLDFATEILEFFRQHP